MAERKNDIDIATIVDTGRHLTYAEAQQFCTVSANRADYRLYRDAVECHRRENVHVPDVDAEWEIFASRHKNERHVLVSLRTVAAAVLGAAAMLVAVIVYHGLVSTDEPQRKLVSAMQYDSRPQRVELKVDGQSRPLAVVGKSISFRSQESLYNSSTSSRSFWARLKHKFSIGRSDEGMDRVLSTPRGADFKVTLSDGTDVWLNAESSLRFSEQFGEVRKVKLTGEAFFKVAHDASRPFIVETGKMNVKVLGTEFDLRNYDSESPHVALVKGAVEILNTDDSPTDVVLRPGQGASVNAKGEVTVSPVDVYAIKQWVDGFFYFQDQTLLSVLTELSRWYNVSVTVKDRGLVNEKIHFSALRRDNLQKTIDSLNKLLHSHITIVGHQVIVK